VDTLSRSLALTTVKALKLASSIEYVFVARYLVKHRNNFTFTFQSICSRGIATTQWLRSAVILMHLECDTFRDCHFIHFVLVQKYVLPKKKTRPYAVCSDGKGPVFLLLGLVLFI